MQALYLLALDPIAETRAAPNAYGFRLERSTADALEQCHRVWSPRWAAPWSLEGAIRSCFDSLSHDWWIVNLPLDQGIRRKGWHAGWMDKHVLYPTEAGVPPGGVASPVMMHLALNGLERHSQGALPTVQGHTRPKVHVIRFADDVISTGRSTAFLEDEVRPLVEQCLAERGRALSQTKTRGTHMEDGFDGLGTQVRQSRGKLLCTPAKKNVPAFLDTIRGIVKRHKQAITGNLIRQLNPVIRGWAHYHPQGASKRTFAQVDQHLFTLLWPWARRRHPQPSRPWIRDQDFRSEDGNTWVFGGHLTRAKGTRQDVRLFRASSVPIRRHTTIIGEANPYAPQGEPDFEARLGLRRAHHLKGRRHLRRLWKEQDGLCAVCHQRITKRTGWHRHHLGWRTPGGADRAENRVRRHPHCHAQVHSHGLTVAKRRPPSGVGKACAACRETCPCRSEGAWREQSRPATRRVPGDRHPYRDS